jgi:hypothetical protein
VLKVKMDVQTRWNFTLDMLSQLISLHCPIDEFILFLNFAARKKEFKGIKTVLPCIAGEKWAVPALESTSHGSQHTSHGKQSIIQQQHRIFLGPPKMCIGIFIISSSYSF